MIHHNSLGTKGSQFFLKYEDLLHHKWEVISTAKNSHKWVYLFRKIKIWVNNFETLFYMTYRMQRSVSSNMSLTFWWGHQRTYKGNLNLEFIEFWGVKNKQFHILWMKYMQFICNIICSIANEVWLWPRSRVWSPTAVSGPLWTIYCM